MNTHGKIEFSIEVAFNELVREATKLNLEVNPVVGLMYLPTQAVTQQFKEACRAVLADLGVKGDPE